MLSNVFRLMINTGISSATFDLSDLSVGNLESASLDGLIVSSDDKPISYELGSVL